MLSEMHALLSPTKALTALRMILFDVTKFSEPMRNKSQLKTAPEWAPSDLMIAARLDPCTVQPAYLFPFALPFPRPSWPQFKTSTYQSTSLRHLPLAARKRRKKNPRRKVPHFANSNSNSGSRTVAGRYHRQPRRLRL